MRGRCESVRLAGPGTGLAEVGTRNVPFVSTADGVEMPNHGSGGWNDLPVCVMSDVIPLVQHRWQWLHSVQSDH